MTARNGKESIIGRMGDMESVEDEPEVHQYDEEVDFEPGEYVSVIT